ncbi:hypothetical protein GGS20DRAFT_536030 [Poronia punctata]|nr:hypothetical protein GGS20DRAFT_536030 [Poronia punctata]
MKNRVMLWGMAMLTVSLSGLSTRRVGQSRRTRYDGREKLLAAPELPVSLLVNSHNHLETRALGKRSWHMPT